MFVNGPGNRGSTPGRVIPKTQKWYLMPPCFTLSITRYRSRVKWSNPGNVVAPSPTPQCSSYWKGSFRVALDYGRQRYFFYFFLFFSFDFFYLFFLSFFSFLFFFSFCCNLKDFNSLYHFVTTIKWIIFTSLLSLFAISFLLFAVSR